MNVKATKWWIAAIAAAVIGTMALPKIRHKLHLEKMISTLGNGRAIFTALLAEDMGISAPATGSLSASTVIYLSSTEYFEAMIASGVLPMDRTFFGAPGLPRCDYGVPLQPENNAWCIMVDIPTNAPPRLPVLFTRNLHFTNTGGRVQAFLRDEPPFGDLGANVVFRGGLALRLGPDDLSKAVGDMTTNDLRRILRP